MPALVNSRFGESGIRLDDGTMVCCFDLKKSRNDWRICDAVIIMKFDHRKPDGSRRVGSYDCSGAGVGYSPGSFIGATGAGVEVLNPLMNFTFWRELPIGLEKDF